MSVHTFYRLALLLPLAVPGIALLLASTLGRPATQAGDLLFELLIYSVVYGGVPYVLAAVAAAIWIDHRPEEEIRRLARRSPFGVIALWSLLVTYVAIRAGSLVMLFGLLALGGSAIIALGYAYVAIVFALRAALGRAGLIGETPAAQHAVAR